VSLKKTGDWKLAEAILKSAPADVHEAIKKAVAQEARAFEAKIKQKIFRGPFKPLASKRANGSSKPLMKTGALRAAVGVVQVGTEAFIGIVRGAPGHDGKTYHLAEVHEFGTTIVQRMTPKQRRYLFGVVFKGSAGTGTGKGTGIIVIQIPARPFIRPVFDEHGPGTEERIMARIARLLRGKLAS
jgi:hypothetical protein